MIIKFEGRDWEYDEDRITVQQAVAIHLAYGLTLQDFVNGIGNLDPRSLQCAYWLMLAQNGVKRAVRDCEFPLVAFIAAYADAQQAAAPEQPQPEVPAVPTIPSPPGGPPSPAPAIPTVTTPLLPVPDPPLTVS